MDNQDQTVEGEGSQAPVEPEEASDVEPEEGAEDGQGTDEAIPGSENAMLIQAVPNLDSLYGLREIGREALCWQLSSAKPGNGVEQIRDQSTDTYWQSDGLTQPHLIQVHFARRVAISHVCLYLDYALDESYTPKTISIQCGMTTHDLMPAIADGSTIELNEPNGWCIIPLTSPPDPLDDIDEEGAENAPKRIVRAHLLQIEICAMHQNGRDTHVRQIQLYGPRTAKATNMFQADANADPDDVLEKRQMDDQFTTPAMSQFSMIR